MERYANGRTDRRVHRAPAGDSRPTTWGRGRAVRLEPALYESDIPVHLNHLHVLLSPAESRQPVAAFLRRMKSFTTRRHQLRTGVARLWQYSARDRVLRPQEAVEQAAAYIANNPVRAGLVACWSDWPHTGVFV